MDDGGAGQVGTFVTQITACTAKRQGSTILAVVGGALWRWRGRYEPCVAAQFLVLWVLSLSWSDRESAASLSPTPTAVPSDMRPSAPRRPQVAVLRAFGVPRP